MSTRGRLAILVLVGLLQLSLPAYLIARHERTLREGRPWAFRTAPVDPADAFRGSYLALSLAPSQAPLPGGLEVETGDRVAVPLRRDRDGFASLGPVATRPPATGDWLRARVLWVQAPQHVVQLELPFDRFYFDEGRAPTLDATWRASQHRLDAWVLVRVRGGEGVLADLVVGGRSLRDGRAVLPPRVPGAGG